MQLNRSSVLAECQMNFEAFRSIPFNLILAYFVSKFDLFYGMSAWFACFAGRMDSNVALAARHAPAALFPHANIDNFMQQPQQTKFTEALGELFQLTEISLIDEAHTDNLDDLAVYLEEDDNLVVTKAPRINSSAATTKAPRTNSSDATTGCIKSAKTVVLPGMVERFSINILRYWCLRYQLFSKFDYGVKLDEEGWYSVTPEVLAKHHAARIGNSTVIDAFTGIGGNAIQFAMKGNHVIAIDINPQKIEYAKHNAKIYGVAERIDFVVGDFFEVVPSLKADVVFLSPPWGGPDYAKAQSYDIYKMLKPKDGSSLFQAAQMAAPTITMFLPKTVDIEQLAELAINSNDWYSLEVEKNYINGQLKTITAYYTNVDIGRRNSQEIPNFGFY